MRRFRLSAAATLAARRRRPAAIAPLLLLLALPLHLRAGTLDDFEHEARRSQPPAPASTSGGNDSRRLTDCDGEPDRHLSCDLGEAIAGGVLYLVTQPFVAGGEGSVARLRGETAEGRPVPRRKAGDPELPGVALFLGHEEANDDIHGQMLRGEVGHGFLALRGKTQRLHETGNGDRLELTQAHLLFRGTYGPVQVDLGGGRMWLAGDTHARGRSFLLGASAFVTRHLSLHAVGSNGRFGGNDVRELDGALELHRRYGGVRLGYQRNRAGAVDIEGPYAGLTFFY